MTRYELPPELRGFISVGEASNGGELVAKLFYRKFRMPPSRRHFVVYTQDSTLHVASCRTYGLRSVWVSSVVDALTATCFA